VQCVSNPRDCSSLFLLRFYTSLRAEADVLLKDGAFHFAVFVRQQTLADALREAGKGEENGQWTERKQIESQSPAMRISASRGAGRTRIDIDISGSCFLFGARALGAKLQRVRSAPRRSRCPRIASRLLTHRFAEAVGAWNGPASNKSVHRRSILSLLRQGFRQRFFVDWRCRELYLAFPRN
jgi:hypothetical protein